MPTLFKTPKPAVPAPPPPTIQADASTTLGSLGTPAPGGAGSGAATLIAEALRRRGQSQRKKTLG